MITDVHPHHQREEVKPFHVEVNFLCAKARAQRCPGGGRVPLQGSPGLLFVRAVSAAGAGGTSSHP